MTPALSRFFPSQRLSVPQTHEPQTMTCTTDAAGCFMPQ